MSMLEPLAQHLGPLPFPEMVLSKEAVTRHLHLVHTTSLEIALS